MRMKTFKKGQHVEIVKSSHPDVPNGSLGVIDKPMIAGPQGGYSVEVLVNDSGHFPSDPGTKRPKHRLTCVYFDATALKRV